MIRVSLPGTPILPLALMMALIIALPSCAPRTYYPERATVPYPRELHAADSVDIQVFRDGTNIEIVNSTTRTYENFRLWLNQRYVRDVDVLAAGQTRRFSLWDFYDERGEVMNAGGFFRVVEPDPVRMVQIQLDAEQPMIGLIAIRDEPLEQRERIGP